MKRHRFDPIEVLKSHQTALQERVQDTANPVEKQLLEKRLRNLDDVLQFLTTTRGAVDATVSDPKLNDALAAKGTAAASFAVGNGPNQQHWPLALGTHCGNV